MTSITPETGADLPLPRELASPDTLSWRVCLGWGVGSISIAIMANMFGALLLRFMTDFLGIAAGLAAAMVAASKLYDAVADPVTGMVSDRLKSPIGRRRPFLIAGAILCPLAMAAMFMAPSFPSAVATQVYMFGVLLLFTTAYSVWQVPYIAMAAEMPNGYAERSRLMAYRMYGGTAGQLLSAGGPWLLAYWGSDRVAYGRVGLVLATVMFAACAICLVATRKAPARVETHQGGYGLITQFRMVLQNTPLLILMGVKSLSYLGLACAASAFPFYIKYVLKAGDGLIGTFIAVNTVAMMATIPCWLWLGKRMEKKYVAMIGAAIYGLGHLSWLLAPPGEYLAITVLRMAVQGIGTGGSVLFLQSMFVDTIEYDYQRTGLRREGMYSGLFSLVEKLFSAVGLTTVGAVLAATGYLAAINGAQTEQPRSALIATAMLVAVAPAVASVLKILLMIPYRLSAADMNARAES